MLLLLSIPFTLKAQYNIPEKVKEYYLTHQHQIINQFTEFLSIPNIATEQGNVKNALWIRNNMEQRGISNVQILNTLSPTFAPAVYGEVKVSDNLPTLIFYAHYDGQPVDTTKWAKGLHPFRPVLMSGALSENPVQLSFDQSQYDDKSRIYARGASDDKAGVMAILNAYTALKEAGIQPKVNIKFFFEGEEEAGSDHLYEILQSNKALLAANLWVICDGPVHQSGRKQIVFGVRGDSHLELTIYAAKRPLHSGHYGNWAPNPAMEMVQLLASMKDHHGKVTIKGFYDDMIPLSATERKALAAIPSVDQQMKNELGLAEEEIPGTNLMEAINLPSLNINGLQSANTGKLSANVIPMKAVARLDLRLVMGNDWQRQQQKVINHIKAQGYYVTTDEPTDAERLKYPKIIRIESASGYNAQKTSMDNPYAKRIAKAVQSTVTEKIVLAPTLGGSLPLFVFEQYLHTAPITIPIANHDNNQHAENENIRLSNFREGIATFAAIMYLPD